MSEANPYTAPDAALGSGQEAQYQPKVFSFGGRIGRVRYLAYGISLVYLIAMIMAVLLSFSIGLDPALAADPGASMVGIGIILVFSVVILVLSVMYGKRRLNDLNRSGWWYLLTIVPIANFLLALYMLFAPGSESPNDFGPAPVANSVGAHIAAWLFPALAIIGIAAAIVVPMMVPAS